VLLTMNEVNRLKVVQGYMSGKNGIEEASRILKRRPCSTSFSIVGTHEPDEHLFKNG
jgi:hypothetical protein